MGFLGFALLMIFFCILLESMIIFAAIFLVAGFILFEIHETVAIILFILSGLNLFGFITWKIYEYNFKVTIETSDGEAKIKNSVCSKYKKYIKDFDIEKINSLLYKYPELIYYETLQSQKLLFYGLYHCNIDMMQCALKHGKKFNDPNLNINDNFLCRFFSDVEENTTDEIINTVKFALEHGAKVVTKEFDLYEQAEQWVMNDGVVSLKDKELLSMIKEYMPENT